MSPSHVSPRPGHRAWHLRKRYGLTIEAFDALLLAQRGLCPVCLTSIVGSLPPSKGRPNGRLRACGVDHHHVTGQVREALV